MQNVSEASKYSLIIIGGGIAGLSTALAWSRLYDLSKNRVLILEQHTMVGGCVTTYSREGYRFDTTQIIPDISDLMDFFGLSLPLKKFDDYYARLFLADPKSGTTKIFKIPSTRQAFVDYLLELFPDEKIRIEKFFRYLTELHKELFYLKTEPDFWNILNILYHCPKILSLRNKTYSAFLRKFGFKNQELLEVLDLFSTFSGLSAERCSGLLTASAINATLEGSFRPEKGFIQLPSLMRKKIESLGGFVRTGVKVKQIIIENNSAKGVVLEDGSKLYSDYVITTADTKVSALSLIGIDNLKKAGRGYAEKVSKAAMSASSIFINLGLDEQLNLFRLGFNCGYNVLTTGNGTFEKMYQAWDRNETLLSPETFHCGVICPSLMTGGKPTLSIHVVPAAIEDWQELRAKNQIKYREKKQRIAEHFIKLVEKYMIPDLQKHIRFIDVCTPATFARYLNSPTGSCFDMMPVPKNFGMFRLKTRTPIRNLFLPKFSNGIWPAMQSGLQVVDMITGGKIMGGNARYKR